MSINHVKQQLEEFQREVLAGHMLSDHQSELLTRISEDLAQLCDEADHDDEHLGIIGAELEQQAIEFEQTHPTLSTIMRQIVDTLAKMGV